jgi:CIC family chloride channel protein
MSAEVEERDALRDAEGLPPQVERRFLPSRPTLRRTLALWAAALAAGCLGAVSIYGFRLLITGVEWIFTRRTGSFPDAAQHLQPWVRAVVPLIGGVLAGALLQLERRLPGSKPHIDYIDAARARSATLNDRSTAARTVSSLISVGSGSSIGREGSMVQLSAWLAALIARFLPLEAAERNAVLVCGIAAGLSSAYHAPIAGVIFVLELALGFFARHAIAPVLVACVAASALTHRLVGTQPLYVVPGTLGEPALGVATVAGVVFGLLGMLQLTLLERARGWFRRLAPLWLRLGLGGLAVGLISAVIPGVWGNGYSVLAALLGHGEILTIVAALLLGKLLATIASAGSGTVGGVFTPTLFTGAMSGFLIAGLAQPWLAASTLGDPRALAVIGMGAVLAAVTHAPLMAIVMVLEMTQQFQLLVPLILASAVAYAISTRFSVKPVYGNPIEGEAASSGPDPRSRRAPASAASRR